MKKKNKKMKKKEKKEIQNEKRIRRRRRKWTQARKEKGKGENEKRDKSVGEDDQYDSREFIRQTKKDKSKAATNFLIVVHRSHCTEEISNFLVNPPHRRCPRP